MTTMPVPTGADAVVIGVDIGTTSTISVAYDAGGVAVGSHSAGYPLSEPYPGWAEQDPELIYGAVLETIRTGRRRPRPSGRRSVVQHCDAQPGRS